MLSNGKTFRVFISSTFSDFKAERNALQRFVFPKLRELCRSRGARFQAIDLRWGVSDEASHDQQAMIICLEEIGRCQRTTFRPNFIALLGDRYGWRPVPNEIPSSRFDQIYAWLLKQGARAKTALLDAWYEQDKNALPPRHWLKPRGEQYREASQWERVERDLLAILQEGAADLDLDPAERSKLGASATEQEIGCGLLRVKDAPEHVHIFFRSIRGAQRIEETRTYLDHEEASMGRLERLKANLRQVAPQRQVHDYGVDWTGHGISRDHLGPVEDDQGATEAPRQDTGETPASRPNLCQDVFDGLAGIIRHELEVADSRDALVQEVVRHQEYAQTIADPKLFIGRAWALGQISRHLEDKGSAPLVVYGASGTGKSTLLARAINEAQRSHPDAVCIFRFIGVTPASSNGPALLESLCLQISRAFGMEQPIPGEYFALTQDFAARLNQVPPSRRLFLFFDAVEQLSDLNNARSLSWLPVQLPPQVRLVVSTLADSPCLGVLKRQLEKEHKDNLLELSDMPYEEGEALLNRWLAGAERTLQMPQQNQVLNGFKKCSLPLYLKLAFEQARHWRSSSEPCQLPATVPEIIQDLFQRLEHPARHGALLVAAGLGYLAAAKNGLTEDELLDLLSRDEEVFRHFKALAHHDLPEDAVQPRLPVVVWSRLFYDLESYLNERGLDGTALLAFFHRQFSETAETAYLSGPRRWQRHRALAGYFAEQPHRFDTAGERWLNLRKLSELPYQQRKGHMWTELHDTLCDLSFIEAKCLGGMTYELVADYNTALESVELTASQRQRLSEFARFIRLQSHVLAHHPELAFQQALNEPDASAPAEAALRKLASGEESRPRLRWANKPQSPSACKFTLVGHRGEVNTCDVSSDGRSIVSAAADQVLKIWDTASGRELLTLSGHRDSVEACAFSPDSSRVVSADRSGQMKLWDALSGQELKGIPFVGHNSAVATCVFSPDGAQIVSASWDKTLKVWDAATGEARRTLRGDRAESVACGFSPDGSRMVSGACDGTLKLWDARVWRRLTTLQAHELGIWKCGFSPDGKFVFTASEDATLKRWSWEDANLRLLTTYRGHEMHVWSFAITPDGTRMVSAAKDKTIRLWDVATGQLLANLRGHEGDVLCLVLVPGDESQLVSCSWDTTLKIWDLKSLAGPISTSAPQSDKEPTSGKRSDTLPLRGPLLSCSCSPDGKMFAAGAFDGYLRLWEARTGSELGRVELHPKEYVVACQFSPDSHWILSAAWNGALKLFDMVQKCDGPPLPRHKSQVLSCGFSRDGTRIFSCSADQIVVWDCSGSTIEARRCWRIYKEGFVTCVLSPDGHWLVAGRDDGRLIRLEVATKKRLPFLSTHDGLVCSAISPDGTQIVTAANDGTLKVWDSATRKERITLEGHTNKVQSCSFSPDGRRVVSGSYDRRVKVWDCGNPARPVTLSGHADSLQDVCFSADGGKVLSTGMDGTLRLWDADTGLPLGCLVGPGETINTLAFAKDGTRVATASHLQTVRICDGVNGAIAHTLQGHTGDVLALAFTPDGRRLVSASADRSLRLWDVADGRPLFIMSGHRGPVVACDVSPNGQLMVSGSWDGTVKTWNLETGAELGAFEGHEGWVQQVLFSPDGQQIISCALDRTVRIWNTFELTLHASFVSQGTVFAACAIAPDGSRLVTGHGGGVLTVWDTRSGQPTRTLAGHTGAIRSCAISPDGSQILSASMDKTLRIWDAESGRLQEVLSGHHGGVLTCGWSPDGQYVLSGSEDAFIKIWVARGAKEICRYWANAPVQTVRWNPVSRFIAGGDSTGRMHLLEFQPAR